MLTLCMLTCFTSCDTENKEKEEKEEMLSQLTPDQHKVEIENVGKAFVDKFNASENEVVAKSLQSLVELISAEDSNLSDLFTSSDLGPAMKPTETLRNTLTSLTSVITKNNIQALTGGATENLSLDEFVGIYTHDGTSWSKAAATNKIELKYDQGSVFAFNYSGGTSYTGVEGYEVEVPGKIIMTLKVGEQEVLNYTMDITLSSDQKTVGMDINLALSTHYKWAAKIDLSGETGSIEYEMSIRDETIMKATVELTGSNMTNPDNYASETYPDGFFKNATLEFQVMTLNLKGSANMNAIIMASNDLGWPESGNEEASEAYAKKEDKIYNDNTELAIYYAETAENAEISIANIKFKADWKTNYYWSNENQEEVEWKEWNSSPILVFASDSSEVSFDDYFTEANFSSLITATKDLINEFATILGLDPVK